MIIHPLVPTLNLLMRTMVNLPGVVFILFIAILAAEVGSFPIISTSNRLHQIIQNNGFALSNSAPPHAITATSLSMAGGMGMATKPPKGKKDKKKGKKSGGGGGGEKRFDIAKAMIKSEKLYDDLMSRSTKALAAAADDEWEDQGREADVATEYIVTARARGGSAGALAAAADWIPVAQVCIVRPSGGDGDDGSSAASSAVRAAVSYYCREINYAATLAAPSLKSLPRSVIEYGAEPLDSWVKYVYEDVIEGKAAGSYVDESDGSTVSMTKSRARELLGLEAGCSDASLIKSAYKRRSMELHPDRFVNSDRSREEIEESTAKFGLVKMAYEALNSGVRARNCGGDDGRIAQSWYESLGGKSRTEFTGAIDLISVQEAGELCNKVFKSAVVGLDPDLTMAFVARNQAAAR